MSRTGWVGLMRGSHWELLLEDIRADTSPVQEDCLTNWRATLMAKLTCCYLYAGCKSQQMLLADKQCSWLNTAVGAYLCACGDQTFLVALVFVHGHIQDLHTFGCFTNFLLHKQK